VAMGLAMTACGGDEPPTCRESLDHYYRAGCTLPDTTVTEAIAECEGLQNGASPTSCLDELEALRICMAGVPLYPLEGECDCPAEFAALMTCG
jgi:hypothetical protein